LAERVDDISGRRYAAWFRDLDSWTEYWDIYHPETRGRFYFGDGRDEAGLLSTYLPRERVPALFRLWRRMALVTQSEDADHREFAQCARQPEVASSVMEVDRLVSRLFREHFGEPVRKAQCAHYL